MRIMCGGSAVRILIVSVLAPVPRTAYGFAAPPRLRTLQTALKRTSICPAGNRRPLFAITDGRDTAESPVDTASAPSEPGELAGIVLHALGVDELGDLPGLEKGLVNAGLFFGIAAAALTALATVDASVWRGWTPLEVIGGALPHAWNRYESSLSETPTVVAGIITAVTYYIGDLVAQALPVAKELPEGTSANEAVLRVFASIDRIRVVRSTVVGGLLLGPMAHEYYGWAAGIMETWPVYFKIAFDQLVYVPFYNCVYFVALGLLAGEEVLTALTKLVKDQLWPSLVAGWKMWPFVGLITYSFIPARNRLLFVDAFEIVYSFILATIANGDGEAVPAMTANENGSDSDA